MSLPCGTVRHDDELGEADDAQDPHPRRSGVALARAAGSSDMRPAEAISVLVLLIALTYLEAPNPLGCHGTDAAY